LCFDSLETLGNNVSADQWTKILSETAAELTLKNSYNITALHVGSGGGSPKGALQKAFKHSATATPKDYSGYRDSEGKQIVVWKKNGLSRWPFKLGS
jgi:hypothetical protein